MSQIRQGESYPCYWRSEIMSLDSPKGDPCSECYVKLVCRILLHTEKYISIYKLYNPACNVDIQEGYMKYGKVSLNVHFRCISAVCPLCVYCKLWASRIPFTESNWLQNGNEKGRQTLIMQIPYGNITSFVYDHVSRPSFQIQRHVLCMQIIWNPIT